MRTFFFFLFSFGGLAIISLHCKNWVLHIVVINSVNSRLYRNLCNDQNSGMKVLKLPSICISKFLIHQHSYLWVLSLWRELRKIFLISNWIFLVYVFSGFHGKKKNKSINPDHCGYEDICVLQLLNFFFITFKLMWTNSVFQPFLRAQVNNYQRTPLSEVWATTAMLDRGFLATFSFRVTILAYYSAMH